MHVIAASGRRPASIKRVFSQNDLMLPAVCLDGALGRDLAANEDFHQAGFATDVAVAVLDGLLSIGLEPVVNIATGDDRDCVLGPEPSTHPDHVAFIRHWHRRGDLHHAVHEQTVLGFGFCGLPKDVRRQCESVLPEGLDLTSGPDPQYGGYGLTVRPPGVSKWSGVAAYCARHDIDEHRVLAVGDGHNDRELLANAAIPCAITGGDPELTDTADHLIAPPATGGWAEIVELIEP